MLTVFSPDAIVARGSLTCAESYAANRTVPYSELMSAAYFFGEREAEVIAGGYAGAFRSATRQGLLPPTRTTPLNCRP
jgi:hypothetical protein